MSSDIRLGDIILLVKEEDQDIIRISLNGECTLYNRVKDIPITLCKRKVYSICGYNAEGYDGLEIQLL